LRIALRAGDFPDVGGRETGVVVGVRGRLGGDSRSLGSMLEDSMEVDAGDVDVGVPCGTNIWTMEERLGVME